MIDLNQTQKAAAAAGIQPDVNKAANLIAYGYQGPFQLWYGNNQYLGHGFGLVGPPAPGQPDQTVWVAKVGTYNQYTGYNIYLPNANKVWQAVQTNGPLRYWNDDNKAKGGPQDWELFVFLSAGVPGFVKIRNLYGNAGWIQYQAQGFSADGNANNAAIFVIQ